MRINPLEWWRERQAQKRLTEALNRLADDRERQDRAKKLKVEVERIQVELWNRGFNVVKANSVNDHCDNARFYSMTPSGRLVEINVGINGGFSIEEVMR
jgi:hypothetical protein